MRLDVVRMLGGLVHPTSFAVTAGCVVVEWLCSRLPDISRSVVQVCLELPLLGHWLSRFPGYPRAPE